MTALAAYQGQLIAGGNFSSAGGVAASRIARWDGSVWQPLGAGVSNFVWDFTVLDIGVFGQLVAGGGFSSAGDAVSAKWGRWGSICAPGDIDQDGVVGPDDLETLLRNWGPCPAPCPMPCPADVDADCSVGIRDFLILLAHWG